MRRVVVGLVCLMVAWPTGGAFCQVACEDSGGLLDLVFEVATAPVDLLNQLSGHGGVSCSYGNDRPETLRSDCVSKEAVRRCRSWSVSVYGTPAAAYDGRETLCDCRPRKTKTSYASRPIAPFSDCPACPSRRISKRINSNRGGATISTGTALRKRQPNPREIIVRIETDPQSKSSREIIVRVEPGESDHPIRAPEVKVITNPVETSQERSAVKVETKPISTSAKQTVIRVEIKQRPAANSSTVAPPQPDPKLKSSKPKKKKKTRPLGGCYPYGAYYRFWTGFGQRF